MDQQIVLNKKCNLTKQGIEFNGELEFQEWISLGSKLREVQGAVHFWIGDWLNYGERAYGEAYSQAMDETSYSYQTLANDKWVSSRIAPSRRRENLSFEHHKEVADLEPEDQEKLLTEAEQSNLNRSKFRKLVYHYKVRLDFPNMSEDDYKKQMNASEDFERVQQVVNFGLSLLEKMQELPLDTIADNARDYLLSHLRDVVSIAGTTLLKYEKKPRQNAISDGMDEDPQLT